MCDVLICIYLLSFLVIKYLFSIFTVDCTFYKLREVSSFKCIYVIDCDIIDNLLFGTLIARIIPLPKI